MTDFQTQDDWRFCNRCLTLVWGPAVNSEVHIVEPGQMPPPIPRFCPSGGPDGGAHETGNSFNFVLTATTE